MLEGPNDKDAGTKLVVARTSSGPLVVEKKNAIN